MSAPLHQQQPQQNEVHHHHHHHHQQPPIINNSTTISFMDLVRSGFSTLYQHKKQLDDSAVEQMRLKNDILLECLQAYRWKSCGDILVSPEHVPKTVNYADQAAAIAAAAADGFDFENLIEGESFVYPCNYGHKKSGETLDRYNVLYSIYVLDTELGRRLIQKSIHKYLPTSTLVDQVQVDKSKNLVDDNFKQLIGSIKGLAIGGATTPQHIDDALNVNRSIGERLELLRDRHLEVEREKNKRQLELVSQNELLSSDDNKKQRTDTNQDAAVREDSISASTPMEEDSDVDSVDEDASQDVEFECDDKDVMTTDSPLSSTLTLPDNLNTSDNESEDEVTLVDGTVSVTLVDGTVSGNDNDADINDGGQLPTTPTTINSPPTSQPSNHDIECLSDSSKLTIYLHNQHTILSKYSKTPQNTAITEKSTKSLEAFKDIPNCINALGLSTDVLESLDKVMKLEVIDEARSGSLFDAFQTQYGTGAKKINNLILPELKAESYNNVQRCKLSPFWDKSDCTINVRAILIGGLNNGDSASSITKSIRDGNEKHNWAAPKFSSRPILEEQSNENDTLAPIVGILARGSSGTGNNLTSQVVKCFTTSYLLVKTGILPSHTEISEQVFAAFDTDRDEVYDAQAVSSFISFLLKTPQKRLVYLSVNEILRVGLPPKDAVTLVLIFINIHPNIKLLSTSELGMPFLGVVLRNYEFYEGERLINQVFGGGAKLPGVKLVGYPDSELAYKLDAEITIDSEYQVVTNGSNKTTIKKFAESLLKHLRDIEKQNKTVIQIEDGIKSGLSHPKAGSIGGNVCVIVDEVSTYHVTKDNLPLDQQPTNIDKVMDEKIAAKLPINIGKKKYVIIYLRNTNIDQSDSIFKLAADQFTICYAAGVARKLINKETELIIIFDNGNHRDGELNPGLARAFAYICDGNVIAFISSTSIRCTNLRVLFKCLQGTCSGSKTQLITAQHSSELAAVFVEYEYGRVVANKIRYNKFDATSETLRGGLCDLLKRLSEYMSTCSRWRISKSNSLFLNEMKHAIEQQRLEKEAISVIGKATSEDKNMSPEEKGRMATEREKNERVAGWTSHLVSLQGTGFAQDDRVRVNTEGDRVWLVKGIREDGRFKLRDESDKETIYVKKRYILAGRT